MYNMSHSYYKAICRLGFVNRFNGIPFLKPTSVADHSYRVANLSLLIVDEHNARFKNKVSVEEVLRKALIHDVEEYRIGDIPTPVKAGIRDHYKKIAKEILEEDILRDVKYNKEAYVKSWEEDKEDESGKFILVADKLEALLSAYFEIKMGNNVKDLHEAQTQLLNWFINNQDLWAKYYVVQDLLEPYSESFKKVA